MPGSFAVRDFVHMFTYSQVNRGRARMSERRGALDLWNEIQLDPVTMPSIEFDEISDEEGVQEIVAWFLENFEDPAESTPYDGAEGGYQYIWGGPYDARDIIETVFTTRAQASVMKAAVDRLEETGHEWAPNSNRIQPPEDDLSDPQPDTASLFSDMRSRIQALEEALAKARQPGPGHNNPPEPIEDPALPALTSEEVSELQGAIDVIKAQPEQPAQETIPAIENAGKVVDRLSDKVGRWMSRRADDFSQEVAKESGKELGRWTARLAIWTLIADHLSAAAHSIAQWLQAIHLPF